MFRSHFIQPNDEEQLKYASGKGDRLLRGKEPPASRLGINLNSLRQNGSSKPPNTITYVSPPSSPNTSRNQFQERTDNDERMSEPTTRYESMDNQRDDTTYSYKDISDNSLKRLKELDPAHHMLSTRSRASTAGTQALDLKHNDNAFHIVASLIVERFEEQLSDENVKSIRVKAGDMYHMERVVPNKDSFINAVQYRVKNCPKNSTKPVHEVTRRCQVLGLDRKGDENLLYAPIGSIFEISETTEPRKIKKIDVQAVKNAKLSTLDDLARQQLTTELEEAENLMKESVTEEAKGFWEKQTVELQAKLRALDGNEEPVKKDMNYFKTHQSLMATFWQTVGYAPPVLEDQDEKSEETDPEKGIELTTKSPVVSPSNDNSSEEELPIVDVVAPNDLPGGYQFEAELNGKRFLATVPIGGVKKGKTFYCYMEPMDDSNILAGAWKDAPEDIFKYGYDHPMVLVSLLCPLLALSQVMERIGLDITGKKIPRDAPEPLFLYTPRGMALSMLSVWAGLNIFIFSGFEMKVHNFLAISAADKLSLFLVNASLLGFTIYAAVNTRNYIMDRYDIPVDSRVGNRQVETFLAAILFPISIAQMGRHTAAYEMQEGAFCQKTGIAESPIESP